MILLIDNYDSFTWNLYQYFCELGAEVLVRRNDALTLEEIAALAPEKIVISPGPCTPDEAGISLAVIRHYAGKTPLLVTPGMMIGAERTLTGSFVSTPAQTERALQFSHLFQALPVTERLPFERANEALSRLKQGLARYRIVLTMNQDN